MRLLRKLVVVGVIAGVGMTSVLAQDQHAARVDNSPKNVANDTVAWLNDFIAKNAGFTLSKTLPVSGAKLVQGKLVYKFNTGDTCHINWQAVGSGDEELGMLYPGTLQDEDFATIVPDSIYLQPFDVQGVLGGGSGEPGTPGYWKLTAHYVYGFHGVDEAFGFIFSDAQVALHAAEVLDQAVNVCRGPRAAEIHEGEGCDSSPTSQVEIHYSNIPEIPPSFINHDDVAVSCVVTQYGRYFSGKKRFRVWSVAFDIAPGDTWAGNTAIQERLIPSAGPEVSCYPKDSVDIQKNSCSDLYHPLRWENPKPAKEPATPPQPTRKGLQTR